LPAGQPEFVRMRTIVAAVAVVGLLLVLWLVWDVPAMMAALRSAGPVPFFAVMAVAPAFGAPLTPFFLLAGASFGVGVGVVGSLLALGLNLCLCYWIARSALQRRLESLLRRFDYELPCFEEGGGSAVRFTLVVKLAPGLPGTVKHYGLALAGVPFPIYFFVSMLVTGLYGGSIVVLGESVLEHDVSQALVVGALIVALGGAVTWWRSRSRGGGARLPTGAATPGRELGEPVGSV
jgi:uncharacterized membrane protein YdjX (TVP38/TMEM64 family)